MRAVLVFCEGNHDVVFVSRSLGANGAADWLDKPIGELPYPFGPRIDPADQDRPLLPGVIEKRYAVRALDAMRVRAAAHPPTPAFEAFLEAKDKSVLYVLMRSHGDDAVEATTEFLSALEEALEYSVSIQDVAVAFLLDADDEGVSGRQTALASRYEALLNGQSVAHASWVKGKTDSRGKTWPVGLFVFFDSQSMDQTGTLESILVPMVEQQWPARWSAAGEYIRAHAAATDPVSTKVSEFRKAQICATGQFVCPGDPMSQVLSRKGLPASAFNGPESQALVDFLTKNVPW